MDFLAILCFPRVFTLVKDLVRKMEQFQPAVKRPTIRLLLLGNIMLRVSKRWLRDLNLE